MPRKSAASDVVRRSADANPPADPGHLAHLLKAMAGPVDTSEIPETRGRTSRVRRDASGRLPQGRPSPIRTAILESLGRQGMTRYRLWHKAHVHCSTLTQSAVYEYLRGQRDIGVPYVEALLEAAGLTISPRKASRGRVAARRTRTPKVGVG